MLAIRVIAIVLFVVSTAYADIYSYVDENGVICLTDTPTREAKLMPLQNDETPKLRSYNSVSYQSIIKSVADKYSIDPSLIHAVITTESNYNQGAVSRKGAMGLMQLMPSTASLMGVSNPFRPEENIEGGTKYLRYLLDRFGGDLRLALAAYNAGPEYVQKYGTIPPISETKEYVKKVLLLYNGNEKLNVQSPATKKIRKPTPIYKVILDDGTVIYTNTDFLSKSPEPFRF